MHLFPQKLFIINRVPTCSCDIIQLQKITSSLIQVWSNMVTLCDEQSNIKAFLVDAVQVDIEIYCTYNLRMEREWVIIGDDWMSNTIQKEIITQLVHAVQSENCATDCDVYGLTASSTTDVSTSEQFPCSLHYADSNLESPVLMQSLSVWPWKWRDQRP